jgi:hypothetical protein
VIATLGGSATLDIRLTLLDKDWKFDDKLASYRTTVTCTLDDATLGATYPLKGTFSNVDLKKAKGVTEGSSVELVVRLQIKVPKMKDVDGRTHPPLPVKITK